MRQSTGIPQAISKSTLRRQLQNSRRNLSTQTRSAFDKAIQQHLMQLLNSRNAHLIAGFWPFDGEPDITPLGRRLMKDGRRLALPVVSGDNDHAMEFHAWRADTILVKNRYGIPEPRDTDSIELKCFDTLVMPLVAYDRCGNRLGMGSGYYDRCLEPLRNSATPFRVGIAYGFQEVGKIEYNSWDIPLHAVVNENEWYTFDIAEPDVG